MRERSSERMIEKMKLPLSFLPIIFAVSRDMISIDFPVRVEDTQNLHDYK